MKKYWIVMAFLMFALAALSQQDTTRIKGLPTIRAYALADTDAGRLIFDKVKGEWSPAIELKSDTLFIRDIRSIKVISVMGKLYKMKSPELEEIPETDPFFQPRMIIPGSGITITPDGRIIQKGQFLHGNSGWKTILN